MIASIRRSVANKLLAFVLAVTLISLLVFAGAMSYINIRNYQAAVANDLSTQADILGQVSTPALEFNDPLAAKNNLAQLKSRQNIVAAAIYSRDDRLFAQYLPEDSELGTIPASPEFYEHRLGDDRIRIFRRIVHDREAVGTIYLEASYDRAARLKEYFMVLSAIMLGALVVAILAAVWLQKALTRPIVSVADVARRVVASRDYSMRVQKSTEDEVGLLVDAFNEMLNEIGKRSRALEESNNALAHEADERRAAEEALRQLNESLAERIAARTAELEHAHEQLRQAQKMEAIGQLTGGIAHDFNNILAVMSGNVEIMQLLQAQQKGADLGRYLASTMKSVERAAALTHRLLAFSRRQALDPRPTDVNRLIVSMADLVRSTVGPAINVSTHLAGDLWHTVCDQHQLENALLNLVINARDAMPQGGRLTITTANVAQDERPAGMKQTNCIVMSVADSGTGMPPEVLKRAFDPFFTTKPQGQGTGLGLSMVYGFVSQSGGDVQITSAPGEGTNVRIYLPARQDAGVPEEPAAAASEYHRPAADSTILVVDDESDIRGMIVERLSEQGYTVLQAEDGPNALQVLESAPQVELLVTDIGLPGGMNGRQLADRVRREREHIKVLLITGYADVGVVGNSQLEFGTELMTKPFRMEAFVDKVRSMTDGDSMTVA